MFRVVLEEVGSGVKPCDYSSHTSHIFKYVGVLQWGPGI